MDTVTVVSKGWVTSVIMDIMDHVDISVKVVEKFTKGKRIKVMGVVEDKGIAIDKEAAEEKEVANDKGQVKDKGVAMDKGAAEDKVMENLKDRLVMVIS